MWHPSILTLIFVIILCRGVEGCYNLEGIKYEILKSNDFQKSTLSKSQELGFWSPL